VWSPDGSEFVYELERAGDCGGDCPKLFVAKADGRAQRRATNDPIGSAIQIFPAWSPDGTRLVYSDSALPPSSFGLAVARIGGSPRSISGDGTTWDIEASWSPDGNLITFTRDDGLYVVAPSGGVARRIVAGGVTSPDWSTDGTRIMFRLGQGDLYTVAPNGRARLRIARHVASADWAPNGRRIVASGAGGVFTIRPDGTGRRQLTTDRQDRQPAWSPGAAMIAYQHHADLWLMSANGTHRHLLVRHGAAPMWQPPL
jgi:Tol biopolymer transport system component